MKNKFFLLLWGAMLTTCKNINSEKKKDINRTQQENANNVFKKDSIYITKLPFGSKFFFDSSLFKKTGQVTDENPSLDSLNLFKENFFEEDNSLIQIEYNPFKQVNRLWDINQVVTVDYSFSDSDIQFKTMRRLPDIYRYNVYLCSFSKNLFVFDCTNFIDLVVVNDSSIHSVNLAKGISKEYGGCENEMYLGSKHFYIDSNYIIHVKYFVSFNDGTPEFLAYIKYKILPSGEIVRWYDIEKGHYKTDVEEGEVKNHMREGKWKEIFGMGQEDVVFSFCEYMNGLPQGEQVFYNVKSPDKIRLRINAKTKEILEEGE